MSLVAKLLAPSHVLLDLQVSSKKRLFEQAGLTVEEVQHFDKPIEFEPWLARVGCEGEDAARVHELLADRIEDGWVRLDRIALKGRK